MPLSDSRAVDIMAAALASEVRQARNMDAINARAVEALERVAGKLKERPRLKLTFVRLLRVIRATET